MNKNPKTSDEYYHITRVGSYPLTDFYESKPETAYEELNKIMDDLADLNPVNEYHFIWIKLNDFKKEYESQLKELK